MWRREIQMMYSQEEILNYNYERLMCGDFVWFLTKVVVPKATDEKERPTTISN